MADRSAPKCGYDVGVKRQYRREVWKALASGLYDKPCKQVVLMPSIEGDEIDVALSHGFRQHNMHVVDENPAIVATLKRRYPSINTYGVELERALERIVDRVGRVDVANLDLCSQLNNTSHSEISAFSCMGGWANQSRVAVTVMRGREPANSMASRVIRTDRRDRWEYVAVSDLFRSRHSGMDLNDNDCSRLTLVSAALNGMPAIALEPLRATFPLAKFLRSGTYRAGQVSMLWSAWGITYVMADAAERERLDRLGQLFKAAEAMPFLRGISY